MKDNILVSEINSTQEVTNDHVVQELRVLAVDAQVFSLHYLCAVLHNCNYKVKTTTSSAEALNILSANKHGFDIILVDVDSANLNGFKLMEIIGLEKELSVIMVTGDDSLKNLTKGLLYGAVDYILKPVGIQEIKNAVQNLRPLEHFNSKLAQLIKVEEDETNFQPNDVPTIGRGVAHAKMKGPELNAPAKMKGQKLTPLKKHSNSKARIKVEFEDETNIQATDVCTRRLRKNKERFIWTPELDAKFVNVVQMLEKSSEVSPRRIFEIMKDTDQGLTKTTISSHLQKYRLLSKKRKADQTSILHFDKEFSSIRSIKRRKWDVEEGDIGDDRGADPSKFNTVMSQRTIPYGSYQSLLYNSLEDPNIQSFNNYYNHCLDMNMHPHNVGSKPVSGTTFQSPKFHIGECSNPSYPSSAPFCPSVRNSFFGPETDVTFVPNLVSGTTMDYTNNDEYPDTTVLTRNGETNGRMISSTTEIINLEDDDDDFCELINMSFEVGSSNFVSLLTDDDLLNMSFGEGSSNFVSLLNDEDVPI